MQVKINKFCLHFLPYLQQICISSFPRWCSNIIKVWWEVLYAFYRKFYALSSSETLLNRLRFDKARADYRVVLIMWTRCRVSECTMILAVWSSSVQQADKIICYLPPGLEWTTYCQVAVTWASSFHMQSYMSHTASVCFTVLWHLCSIIVWLTDCFRLPVAGHATSQLVSCIMATQVVTQLCQLQYSKQYSMLLNNLYTHYWTLWYDHLIPRSPLAVVPEAHPFQGCCANLHSEP